MLVGLTSALAHPVVGGTPTSTCPMPTTSAGYSAYCNGTKFSDPNYLCGDKRLGPIALPTDFPLDTLVATYDRLGGLCPGPFLQTYYNSSGNGSWIWPTGDGFQLDTRNHTINGTITLSVGVVIDRFGPENGSFVSPVGAPYMQRSLPPQNLDWPMGWLPYPYNYHLYQVIKPFNVSAGPIAPAFGQPGQGVQYNVAPNNISGLVEREFLRSYRVSSDEFAADKKAKAGQDYVKYLEDRVRGKEVTPLTLEEIDVMYTGDKEEDDIVFENDVLQKIFLQSIVLKATLVLV
ncbi:hypothetical protein V1506DRAFT_508526 [Lipomyces tetrasporus]